MARSGYWSDLIDGYCLATIYKIKFNIITVEGSDELTVIHTATIHGFRCSGRMRLSNPTIMTRMLVFFHGISHFGAADPEN